jgi:LAO/AO transport system kinase
LTIPPSLLELATAGDRRALAKLISAVERGEDGLLAEAYRRGGKAFVIGITGPPGAGKSTIVDQLVGRIRSEGSEVAAVLVDPSSPFTGGAILGDRIRMQDRVSDPGVYARSMASRGHLGGVSDATPKAVSILDAAGFPIVLVETVGVGQAEVDIAQSAHTTVVALNPGWGDSIQAAKAGLLEIGDVFVVNKSDRPGVAATVADLERMLTEGAGGDWSPPIVPTQATTGAGIDELWEEIKRHRSEAPAISRAEAARSEIVSAGESALRTRFHRRLLQQATGALVDQVADREIDPWTAARRLIQSEASD